MTFNPSPLLHCCQYVVGCGTAITLPPVSAVIVPASDMDSVFLWAKTFSSDHLDHCFPIQFLGPLFALTVTALC